MVTHYGMELGTIRLVRVIVDKVGRIVIPKRLREQAGITADTELDIVFDGLAIRLEPVRDARARRRPP